MLCPTNKTILDVHRFYTDKKPVFIKRGVYLIGKSRSVCLFSGWYCFPIQQLNLTWELTKKLFTFINNSQIPLTRESKFFAVGSFIH